MIKQILAGDLGVKSEVLVGVLVLVVVYFITTVIRRQRKKYPPGPRGLPILGYAPFLTDKPYLKFIEISKQYGDIFSINLGYRKWVVLNSADAIKEALLKPEFLNRPPYGPLTPFKKESPFFTSPIHVWQEQRKFVVQSMKDLGLGKSKIEEHVKDEINAFIEVLKSHGGKPMDPKEPLAPSMSNNITALVFGIRHDYDHPDRVLLDKNAENINKHIQSLGFLHIFPWLKHLYLSEDSKYKIVANAFKSSHKLFHKMIDEHRRTLDPQNIRDYVDRYLIEMKSRKEKDPKTTFNENTLADSATDLFGAGSETVYSSVLWCIYIMAAYPQLQKKVQKEIMDVIGPDRMAELLDQKLMPFTHATILEVLRFITIAPLNFLHYLRLGSQNVIVLNGTSSIREAFAKSEFLGRPPSGSFTVFEKVAGSPFFAHDLNVWQEQRRFVVSTMKDLGLGKSKIEHHIQDEIIQFLKALKSYNGKPMNLLEPLTPSVSNNICALAFGKRYEYSDPERKQLDKNLEETAKVIAQTAAHIFFPWVRHFLKLPFVLDFLKLREGMKASISSDAFLRKKIKEHRETLDKKDVRDFIDSYLIEMEIRKEKMPGTTFTDTTLVGTVGDLFGAGTETLRTTLTWCMYIMAAYPDVQKRVEKEILDTIGPERLPEISDQKEMPFSHAVILEILRWKTTVPLNLLRYTTADTTVAGYDIPKNTTVMTNFWAVHHDPNNWKDPDNFQPERFLSADKKSVIKSQHYMPFSIGRRVCPGEAMAYMEIFLYFVSVLQKFQVKFPEGVKPTFDSELSITYHLKPHKICLISKE